jgi:hypothetical protein
MRPSCRKCLSNSRDCEYEVVAGLTRVQQMKQSQRTLQQKLESYGDLYHYLQTKQDSDIAVLVKRIRSGESFESVLNSIKDEQQQTSPDGHLSEFDANLTESPRVHEDDHCLEEELLLVGGLEATISALQDGIKCFFIYLGTMFPVFTRQELDATLEDFARTCNEDEWLPSTILEKKVIFGELSAVCAVAFQYDRQRLPDGDASKSISFYERAKILIDYVQKENPLRAMRMCALLGIYNVIAKSALAVRYTGKSLKQCP